MRDYTPLVEPFSIDEAFLDVTGSQKLFGPPIDIARQLKQRIRQDVGLTCSVGVAPNKLLAKMASDLHKPDGLTVIDRQDVAAVLWPLPVRELFGSDLATSSTCADSTSSLSGIWPDIPLMY